MPWVDAGEYQYPLTPGDVSVRIGYMKRLWWIIVVLVAAVAIGFSVYLLLPRSPIPGSIKKQLSSTLLVPKSSEIVINRRSVKLDPKLDLLTFTVTASGTKVVVSEQPTPESFTDIPAFYGKVLGGLNEYKKFETEQGTVHLTKPQELHGKQAAVLNTKGTLLFAKPDRDLSDSQWRQFFNSFEIVK